MKAGGDSPILSSTTHVVLLVLSQATIVSSIVSRLRHVEVKGFAFT